MADFPYSPDFNYKIKPRFNVLADTYENNAKQTRLKTSKKLRAYELTFTNRNSTEMTWVSTFHDSKMGSLLTFTMSIEGVTVLGEIVQDTFFQQRVNPNVYTYGFNFQEVVNAR